MKELGAEEKQGNPNAFELIGKKCCKNFKWGF